MEYSIFESSLSPIKAIMSVFGYPTILGRARRSEFWWFTLFAMLLESLIILFMLSTELSVIKIVGYVLSIILAYFYSGVNVRRFHDVGLSGWWILPYVVIGALLFFLRNSDYHMIFQTLQIIGCVYTVAILLVCVRDGEKTENKYGVSPKYAIMGDESEAIRKLKIEKRKNSSEITWFNFPVFYISCFGFLFVVIVIRLGLKIVIGIIIARLWIDIDPLEEYTWYYGIIHGLFAIPNWIYSFFDHDVLCKAQLYTTGYNVWWWIMLGLYILGSLYELFTLPDILKK